MHLRQFSLSTKDEIIMGKEKKDGWQVIMKPFNKEILNYKCSIDADPDIKKAYSSIEDIFKDEQKHQFDYQN